MTKKIIALFLTFVLTFSLLCACSENTPDKNKIQIVCTMFSYYDWTRNITKDSDNVQVTLLLDSGTDLHSYQTTAEDIIKISSADIFIYTGGESDKWVDDVLKTSKNEKATVLNLMECLGEENLCEAEDISGNTSQEKDGHKHEHDEHIWLSLKNAALLSRVICEKITEKDSENKAVYEKNLTEYENALSTLENKYSECVKNAKKDTLIVADRFPFLYLTKEFGLKYSAAFSGCSAESEAGFTTVMRLANDADNLGITHFIITETSDGSVAKTVKNSTADKNQEILTLNSLQSVTKDKTDLTYCGIMEDNLKVLSVALS